MFWRQNINTHSLPKKKYFFTSLIKSNNVANVTVDLITKNHNIYQKHYKIYDE